MSSSASGSSDRRSTFDGGSEQLARWSVVLVGGLLVAVSVASIVRFGSTIDSPEGVVPVIAACGIVAGGSRLRRSDLSPDDIAVVAAWTAATGVLFGVVILLAASAMTSDPLRVGALATSFVAPVGAAAGGAAGYYDAKRRRQHRVTRRIERALETTTDGIAVLSSDGEFVTVNAAHGSAYGYDDPDALVGEHWSICYTDEEADRLRTAVLPAVAETGEWRGEATGLRADGTTFPQELTLTRMDDGGTVSVVRDNSERVERDRQLRAQRRRLRTIVENVPIVLFAFDADGEITLSEGRSLSALGLEPGEAVGESVFEMYADVPDVVDACREALEGATVHRTADLGLSVFEIWMTPIADGAGDVEQVIGTAMDVTEQHERERQIAALHEASRRLTYASTFAEVAETAVDIVDDILDRPLSTLWRYDEADDRLVPSETNDAMADRLGETDGAVAGLGDGSYGMECFRSGEVGVIENYREFDDAAFPELDYGTVVLVPVGDHALLQVGHREVEEIDETERTQLEILQMNLEAALDRAADDALLRERTELLEARTSQMEFINSILRHDVLNGMTVIRARGEFLAAELEGQRREHAETVVKWCDDIVDFVERVQTVLDALSGEAEVSLEAVDAVDLLEAELDRLRQSYPAAAFEASLPEEAYVQADALLGDVLGNVVRNAIEHNDPEDLHVSVAVETGGESTTIRIADDGAGVPPELREAVFRRGESHAKSTGSGFGLFFVDAMVEAYGGDVRIEDNDPGAAFVITLPSAAPEPVAEGPKRDTA